MLKNILGVITGDEIRNATKVNRKHSRRSGDKCVSMINGKMYPIENWSEGGVLVLADDRMFSVNQECNITLKFKLRDEIFDIIHNGTVVRKSDNRIALKFSPIPKDIHDSFQKVVDDFISRNFVESQIDA